MTSQAVNMKRARDTQAKRAIEMFESRMPIKVVIWEANANAIWIEYKRADAEESKCVRVDENRCE